MLKNSRAIFLLMAAFLVVGSMAVSAADMAPLPSPVKITIVHTNDMHSRGVESKTELGYNRISGYVKMLKASNPNVLLLDVGDTFHGLPIANLEQGASIVKFMDAAGYSYMTTGNHDYNYGIGRLLELQKQAKNFKILAANVYMNGKRLFQPWAIENVGGVRVAIFGLATPETAYKTDPKGIEGVVFSNPATEAEAVAYELAGKYDVLVCLAHIGIDGSTDIISDDLAKAVPEIDVILDGHSHSSLKQEMALNKTKTLITSSDANGVSMGVVDLVVGTDRKIVSKTASSVPASTPNLPSDPEVAALIKSVTKDQDPILAQVVGKTAVALEGKREIVRMSSSNLGTLIANSIVYVTGADVSMIGGGGIRDSIPAGDITKRHIFTVLPFGNYYQTTKLKGSEFDAIIEVGVGKLPALDGRFPHFAGMTYTLDATKPVGDRVSNIMIGGKPVDPARTYVFAAPNFDMNGGDGYVMLVGKSYNDFPSDAEVLMAYVKYLGLITNDNMVYVK
jgi:2',3'-cyclic-nucleotide 2'-phosphodiesterase (5'-nucleotidase family)